MLSLTTFSPFPPFPLPLPPRSCANATSQILCSSSGWRFPVIPLFPAKGYGTTEQLCWARAYRTWGRPGKAHARDERVKMETVLHHRMVLGKEVAPMPVNLWSPAGRRLFLPHKDQFCWKTDGEKGKKKGSFFFPECCFPSLFSPMYPMLPFFLLHLLTSLLPNVLLHSVFP